MYTKFINHLVMFKCSSKSDIKSNSGKASKNHFTLLEVLSFSVICAHAVKKRTQFLMVIILVKCLPPPT